MAPATIIDPTVAVVYMILPIIAVNLSLVRELSVDELRSCGRRFGPLLAAALVGTVIGLVVLDRLPTAPLRLGHGRLTLSFVVITQDRVVLSGYRRLRERCFVGTPAAMVGVGGVSGLLFGGTSVGVQLIAYLRIRDLPHGLFVGVVSMVFLGLNGVRVAVAGLLGLYPSGSFALASLGAAVPAVAGVDVGKRLRAGVGERQRRTMVLVLLTLIGLRLVLGGLGFV